MIGKMHEDRNTFKILSFSPCHLAFNLLFLSLAFLEHLLPIFVLWLVFATCPYPSFPQLVNCFPATLQAKMRNKKKQSSTAKMDLAN